MNIINISRLNYGYSNNIQVLKDINLKIKSGEFVCIFGENGSGKSTLIKCILGLNKVTDGKIEVSERIGYLPQITEIQTNFPATIEEIVLSGTIPNSINKLFYTKDDKKRSNEVMKQLNLFDIRKKCFYELSGGQRQRVLIARALCATDKVLLLDEPVNGLDPKIVKEIYELLNKINKDKNITIIMISHDVDRALNYATRIIELENGKIIKDLSSDKYKDGGAI